MYRITHWLVLVSSLFTHTAASQDVSDALVLAQACHVEATWRKSDCSAIYHLAKRKGGTGWSSWLLQYSALRKNRTRRAAEIAEWPWGDIPRQTDPHNKRWGEQRQYALELIAGLHADPCPKARHWGGPDIDPPRGRMVPVVCEPRTANVFYALSPKQ